MELKYYLRGLGLGIVVTAIIMSLTTSKSRTMTDAEIISRAKQLGMIEERTLKDTVSDEEDPDGADSGEEPSGDEVSAEDASDGEEPSADVISGDASGVEDTGDGTVGNSASDEGISDAEDTEVSAAGSNEGQIAASGVTEPDTEEGQTALPDDEEVGSDAPMVITIGNGDGSYAASRKLADVGAVSSAESFDTFLCQNGYDKKIKAGTYTIPAGASNEQMARIITGAE